VRWLRARFILRCKCEVVLCWFVMSVHLSRRFTMRRELFILGAIWGTIAVMTVGMLCVSPVFGTDCTAGCSLDDGMCSGTDSDNRSGCVFYGMPCGEKIHFLGALHYTPTDGNGHNISQQINCYELTPMIANDRPTEACSTILGACYYIWRQTDPYTCRQCTSGVTVTVQEDCCYPTSCGEGG
jgi:hypothetical protein